MPKICEVGEKGLFLPLGGDSEQEWPQALRIVLYGIGLGWCFMGVGIGADRFMEAIEKITAKKVRKYNVKLNRWCTIEVWNPTVANLSLMALGSSAPEILLSCIELFSNEFYSGELGPSTIVGSAAFNLLCIIAVCVCAIPDGEFRRIKEMPVYIITAIFSIFAYLWLLIILVVSSENVVEPWEGILTFLFFPLLLGLAYLADRGYFSGKPSIGTSVVLSADMSQEELAQLDLKIRQQYGSELTAEQVSKIALIQNQKKTRAQYRVEATRAMTGSKRVRSNTAGLVRKFSQVLGAKLKDQISEKDLRKVHPADDEKTPKATIEFAATSYAVLENAGFIECSLTRHGVMETRCSVRYTTREGTAKDVEDFVHVDDTVTFEPGEDKKTIKIEIVDNVSFEDDEDFFVDLSEAKVLDGKPEDMAVVGEHSMATVVIIDDDLPGVLSFSKDTLTMTEELQDWEVEVVVERKNGCTGEVTCKYHTEGSSALPGLDYVELDDTLVFQNHEKEGRIKLNLKARGRYDRTEEFRLVLSDVTGGAKFDKNTDGGDENNILTIMIEPQQMAKDRVDRLKSALAINWDKAKVGHANWADQFMSAVMVNGGEDDDGDDDGGGSPSIFDWFIHILTLPWKLLFACVPPVDYCGGWVCFCCSLVGIGLVTAIINDIASLFGCVLTLGPEVTAITFVALGTSLPDTFASMKAAKEDRYADASIGNVTGSNSVNVFLGLGLPWAIGAIYWRSGTPSDGWLAKYGMDPEVPAQFRDGSFVVKAGSLAFSVSVFCGCAFTCLLTIHLRRIFCQGELGGPRVAKWATTAGLVCLWLLYVGLSTWKSLSTQS